MQYKENKNIFKRASKTHFYASIFFPSDKKVEIANLYTFLRTVDDLADSNPPQIEVYEQFKKVYYLLESGEHSEEIRKLDKNLVMIIDNFLSLSQKRKFEKSWTEALFKSMEKDLYDPKFIKLKDTLEYVYGVAEVVGLMVARVLELPEESYPAARALGRTAQFVNMIRDIDEDLILNRIYFPTDDLHKIGLAGLDHQTVVNNREKFEAFIKLQLERYKTFREEARKGYKLIPRKYRTPIKVLDSIYSWTAEQIQKDPYIIYRLKVKPSKQRVILNGIKALFS